MPPLWGNWNVNPQGGGDGPHGVPLVELYLTCGQRQTPMTALAMGVL